VVSPSSIPRRAGKSVKTDRIDAAELAEYYANRLLRVVAPPDAGIEQDRDLLPSRHRLVHQQGDPRDRQWRIVPPQARQVSTAIPKAGSRQQVRGRLQPLTHLH
jgi:transposase